MKLARLSEGAFGALLSLLIAPAAADLDCKRVVIDEHRFDFSELRGPHSVLTSEYDDIAKVYRNTTFTLDLCGQLKRKDDNKPACPIGTRVCAIEHTIQKDDPAKDIVDAVVPIAGDLTNWKGKPFEWQAERLSTSDVPEDEAKEGVRLSLKGGVYESVPQRAVVELRCAHNLTGTEGEIDPEDKYTRSPVENYLVLRDENSTHTSEDNGSFPQRQVTNGDAALIWNKYELAADKSEKLLYLTWHTKYACESHIDEPQESRHWGFFTWLFILFFLGTAAYLIFGSWINYNRYGARGWDLLPHGDTMRDIPYLLKDWTRRLLNTVQSSGSRGGYSAV